MGPTVIHQVAELDRMDYAGLKERWRVLMGKEPPALSREYLVRRLAYRLQELAYGGLSLSANERLNALAETAAQTKKCRSKDMPVVGTVLVREWNGQRYEVTVKPGGYEYRGCLHKSLTSIAKVITGIHWNGPAFFGLRPQRRIACKA